MKREELIALVDEALNDHIGTRYVFVKGSPAGHIVDKLVAAGAIVLNHSIASCWNGMTTQEQADFVSAWRALDLSEQNIRVVDVDDFIIREANPSDVGIWPVQEQRS